MQFPRRTVNDLGSCSRNSSELEGDGAVKFLGEESLSEDTYPRRFALLPVPGHSSSINRCLFPTDRPCDGPSSLPSDLVYRRLLGDRFLSLYNFQLAAYRPIIRWIKDAPYGCLIFLFSSNSICRSEGSVTSVSVIKNIFSMKQTDHSHRRH